MTPILWLLLAAAAVGATGFWFSWKRRRAKP
jgi:LPXTG-motif cell wall-anchored protein